MNELDVPEVLALTSPEFADVRIDFGLARAEFAAEAAIRQTAEVWAAIDDVLLDAEQNVDVFIDARATLRADERRDYAVRSAAADLAVRLRVSENSVRTWGCAARLLRADLPDVWAAFAEGHISVANVRTVVETVTDLATETRGAFEVAVLDAATRLTPARFRVVARSVREGVHREAVTERHQRARLQRRIVIDDVRDGMSWLSVYLPSAVAHRAVASIEAAARSFQADDARTLEQLRADVAADLLSGACMGRSTGVAVSVTVPVMTLLGHSDEPGTLHGVGPIDAPTARLLAAEAPSFFRILTHPVSGAVLDVDRTVYRVPADLKRTLGFRDKTCRFAGCGRRAGRCDLDHVAEWQDGGTTAASNLMHLCRHHHRLKSVAGWRATAPQPGSDSITWTSPTDNTVEDEPPPF